MSLNFRFLIPQYSGSVNADSDIWREPLPGNRKNSDSGIDKSITYGQYFQAVQSFLEVFLSGDRPGGFSDEGFSGIPDTGEVNIHLEKHGEFYHPARIEFISEDGTCRNFAINVAVSESGMACMDREYQILETLNAGHSFSHIPVVYARESIPVDDSRAVSMFMGRWFKGYHEFHLSLDNDGLKRVVVWDSENGNYYLDGREEFELYRRCSKIMTDYYDLKTFDQIFPWHHAAGDFIVKNINGDIDVKLITVRQYGPMIGCDDAEPDEDTMLEALLIFFINLTIRMRLDRLDGIKDIVWAGDNALKGSVSGFFDSLCEKENAQTGIESLTEKFQQFFLSWNRDDLTGLSLQIIGASNPNAPDMSVVRNNLRNHIESAVEAVEKNNYR